LVAWRQNPFYGEKGVANELVTETIAVPAETAQYTFVIRDSYGAYHSICILHCSLFFTWY
jgi:hypothetical protein